MTIIYFFIGLIAGFIFSICFLTAIVAIYEYPAALSLTAKGLIHRRFLIWGTFFNFLSVGFNALICFLLYKLALKFELWINPAFKSGVILIFLWYLATNFNKRGRKNHEADFWYVVGNNFNTEQQDKAKENKKEFIPKLYDLFGDFISLRDLASAARFCREVQKLLFWDKINDRKDLDFFAENANTCDLLNDHSRAIKNLGRGNTKIGLRILQKAKNKIVNKDGDVIAGDEIMYVEFFVFCSAIYFFCGALNESIKTLQDVLLLLKNPAFRERYQAKYETKSRYDEILINYMTQTNQSLHIEKDFFDLKGKNLDEVETFILGLIQESQKVQQEKNKFP